MLELTQIRTRINLLHKIYALVSGTAVQSTLATAYRRFLLLLPWPSFPSHTVKSIVTSH